MPLIVGLVLSILISTGAIEADPPLVCTDHPLVWTPSVVFVSF